MIISNVDDVNNSIFQSFTKVREEKEDLLRCVINLLIFLELRFVYGWMLIKMVANVSYSVD